MTEHTATCSIFGSSLPDIREEVAALRSSARALLQERSSSEAVRRAMDTELGYDLGAYAEVMALGWGMVAVPEALGGFAMGHRALAPLFYELGRVLYCGPFLSTVGWAIPTLLAAGTDEQADRWVPDLVGGQRTATVAHLDGEVVRSGHDWRLTGRCVAMDGHCADVLIVRFEGAGYVLEGDEVEARVLPTMDQTRRLAEVQVDCRVPDHRRLASDAGLAAGDLTARISLAASQAGGAAACVEMAAEYAGVRRQFGRPIGAFQAVAHNCAEMYLQSTSAWSAAHGAAEAADVGAKNAGLLSRVANAYASEAYFTCAAQNLQVHGGIGFTWEHDAHLHLKRARADRSLLGTPSHHLETIAAHLLD